MASTQTRIHLALQPGACITTKINPATGSSVTQENKLKHLPVLTPGTPTSLAIADTQPANTAVVLWTFHVTTGNPSKSTPLGMRLILTSEEINRFRLCERRQAEHSVATRALLLEFPLKIGNGLAAPMPSVGRSRNRQATRAEGHGRGPGTGGCRGRHGVPTREKPVHVNQG